MEKIRNILAGRVARNVYFWIILIYTRAEFSYTLVQAAFTAMQFTLLAILFYTNNITLIPVFLSRKKYTRYFIYYTLLCLTVSLAYVTTLKAALLYSPAYYPGSISPLVMGGETAIFTLSAFFIEWWPYLISLFFAGCLFAMSWYVMDYQRQQKQIEETKKEHLKMELIFLKNQINPHFLFNTLNNLYALTVKKSDLAPEVVSKISLILRYLIYESEATLVSFKKEEEIMHAYISLVLLGMTNTVGMKFSINADKDYSIPPLLWLPVLENVFKHGTNFIAASYNINYRFSIENNVLHIYSRNTFKHAESTIDMHKGIGLSNLEQRLKLLCNTPYSMQLTKENNYFTTDIKISLS